MSRRQRIAILWWSRLAASLALAFVNFVIQWQASLLLHAPAALATVNVVAQATTPFTFVLAGRLADAYQPRTLMTLGSLLAVLAMCVYLIPFHGVHTLAAFIALSLCVNGFAVLGNVSGRVVIPSWVPREELPAVNARWSWISLLRGLLGYALGGITLALGAPWALGSSVVLFLLSAGLLYRFPRIERTLRAPPSSWRHDLRSVWQHPLLRWSMVFGGSLNFSMGLYLGELILFGRVSIHLNAPSLGLIFGLSTVGSLFAIKWVPPLSGITSRRLFSSFLLLWAPLLLSPVKFTCGHAFFWR